MANQHEDKNYGFLSQWARALPPKVKHERLTSSAELDHAVWVAQQRFDRTDNAASKSSAELNHAVWVAQRRFDRTDNAASKIETLSIPSPSIAQNPAELDALSVLAEISSSSTRPQIDDPAAQQMATRQLQSAWLKLQPGDDKKIHPSSLPMVYIDSVRKNANAMRSYANMLQSSFANMKQSNIRSDTNVEHNRPSSNTEQSSLKKAQKTNPQMQRACASIMAKIQQSAQASMHKNCREYTSAGETSDQRATCGGVGLGDHKQIAKDELLQTMLMGVRMGLTLRADGDSNSKINGLDRPS